jgi:inhibitor of KinA
VPDLCTGIYLSGRHRFHFSKKFNLLKYFLPLNADIKIFSIGDSACTIELGNCINDEVNQKILSMNEWLLEHSFVEIKAIIIAYSSLSVFYEPCTIKKNYQGYSHAFEFVRARLAEAYHQSSDSRLAEKKDIIRIPVCYEDEFGYDLDFVVREKGISKQEIMNLHCSKIYKVYMVGFLPGFAYMGKIDDQLVVPRKLRPEQVPSGSVGITGNQTAIYPISCPGGWHIIGRTPLKLFDANADTPITLTLGALVEFYPVTEEQFNNTDYSVNI